MTKARGPAVDLRMALSYVPGVYAMCRCLVLIYFMALHDLSERISALLVICVILYCDRNIRHESIIDSNALAATIAAAQLFNLLRIKDVASEEEDFVRVTRGWTRLESVVQLLYCVTSMAETCDINMSALLPSVKSKQPMFSPDRTSIVTHALLLSGMVFVHVNKASVGKVLSVSRCACFTTISIVWSYIIGIPTTLRNLHAQEDSREHGSRDPEGRLQSIIFIHLRFAYILIVDLPFVVVFTAVQVCIIIYKTAVIWSDEATLQRMTHPEFFIFADVITDPFSVFGSIVTGALSMHGSKKNVLPLRGDEKIPDIPDDIAAQFKLARAGAGK